MVKKVNEIRERILEGLDLSTQKLIQKKKENNHHLVVSDKGKVVHVKAKEVHKLELQPQ